MARRSSTIPPATSFIGRVTELDALRSLFSGGARLVTLFGPGGIGKTRLALHFGDLAVDAIFVDLSAATCLEDLCNLVARGLGLLPPGAGSADAGMTYVGDALADLPDRLVILDNCESVVAVAAQAVAAWISASRTIRFLTTSRELLGIAGEHAFEVNPLRLPVHDDDVDADAIRLFVDRAYLVRGGVPPEARSRPAMASLVRQLEGSPLAIELAAAWTDVLSLQDLVGHFAARIDGLESRLRTSAERQRSLGAAIAASWKLLQPWERTALAETAVFRAGFSLDAARAVIDLSAHPEAPPLLTVLASLRAKSLLRTFEGPRTVPAKRFGTYDSIRVFALERLREHGLWEGAARRHLQFFVGLAFEALEPGATGAWERDQVLTVETDNLLAAHERALEATPTAADDAVRIALAAAPILRTTRSIGDALRVLDTTLTRSTDAAAHLVRRARSERARILWDMGSVERARSELEGVVSEARASGDLLTEGVAVVRLAQIDLDRAEDGDCAIEAFRRGLAVIEQTGDARALATALADLAAAEQWAGRPAEAIAPLERAIECARQVGSVYDEIRCLTYLGGNLAAQGELESAIERLREAVRLAESHGNVRLEAFAMTGLARAVQERGELSTARSLYDRAVASLARLHDERMLAWASGCSASLLHEAGDPAAACNAYDAAMQRSPLACPPPLRRHLEAMKAAALADLGCIPTAEALLLEVETKLGEERNRMRLLAVSLLRGHLDLAHARAHEAEGDRVNAARCRAAAARRLSSVPRMHPDEDVRLSRRLLQQAVERNPGETPSAAPASPVLRIGPHARWVVLPSGERVELHRQRAIRYLILALGRHRLDHPGQALSSERLVDLGWPGEHVKKGGIVRVRTALSRLRSLGLRGQLVSRDDGYLFVPELEVRLDDEDPSQGRVS
jgi:predicted ATPase